MHTLSLTEIHFNPLTLLSFNQVIEVSNLFNSDLPSNFVKIFPLNNIFSNEKIYKIIVYIILNVFSLVNYIFNDKFLMELDARPKLNKFET